MSKYTMTLQQICDSLKQAGDTTLAAIIDRARAAIFDFDYPFYDAEKKADFERAFIRKFFIREIGYETYALWKLMLQDWLTVEMPYYNKLFTAMELEFNPLHDVDLTKTRTYAESGENDGTSRVTGSASRDESDSTQESKAESATNNETLRLNKTPQGQLSNVANNKYLTEANLNNRTNAVAANGTVSKVIGENSESESDGSSHNESSKIGNETERITGKQGSGTYSEMLIEYQKAMIDIDNLVYAEMDKKLFMQIF